MDTRTAIRPPGSSDDDPTAPRTDRGGDQPFDAGYCVRLDWPDRSHSMAAYSATEARAQRQARRLQSYWCRGPVSPLTYTVVVISRHDWRLHARRGQCRAPDCPR